MTHPGKRVPFRRTSMKMLARKMLFLHTAVQSKGILTIENRGGGIKGSSVKL